MDRSPDLDPDIKIEALRPALDPPGLAALEAEWRALEAVADPSFFQSWTWIGCRLRARFAAPLLLRAHAGGQVVGLALCNGAPRPLAPHALHLHETGDSSEDRVFIEHNAPLLATGHEPLVAPMLAAALRHGGSLQLSGVGDATLQAARAVGRCHGLLTRPAPFATLDGGLDGGLAGWLAERGASTRYQLRRSRRRYEETAGPVTLRRAADVPEALAFLDALAALHQRSWTARGQPGAFADPHFVAFHRALIGRGVPRDEVDLLRLSAGQAVVGYLYNFRLGGRAYAYQGGFDYEGAGPQQAPGLACHHAAIARAAGSQDRIYDFLAGEARYKSSLASRSLNLHWLELVRPLAWRDLLLCSKTIYRKFVRSRGERDATPPS